MPLSPMNDAAYQRQQKAIDYAMDSVREAGIKAMHCTGNLKFFCGAYIGVNMGSTNIYSPFIVIPFVVVTFIIAYKYNSLWKQAINKAERTLKLYGPRK